MPASPPDIARPPARQRLTRREKVSRTRQKLLDAAMKVVGEMGISETSIANITREAKVALGTFYMHFESKQALMEQLLPWAGQLAHEHMDAAVAGARTHVEYEAMNFDALVDFHRTHPFYFRLLSEAEVATPTSYRQHIDRSIERYRGALVRAHDRGELPTHAKDDLEIVATMLTSMKLLLFTRFSPGTAKTTAKLREAYMTFVSQGLVSKPDAALETPPPRRRARTKA